MNSSEPMGEISRDGDHATLRFTRTLRHTPDKVWRALTESEHMRWWMPVDMIGDRSVGSTVKMIFWPDLVAKKGLDPDAGTATIRVWEPSHIFEWVWHGSIVRFDLTEIPQGCQLVLTVVIESDDPDTIVDNAGGFHLWIEHVTTLLDRGTSQAIADADAQHLEVHYRRLVSEA